MCTDGQIQFVDPSTWNIDPEASFFHYCSNETVHGFELDEETFPWHLIPRDIAVVSDMSSNIGTRPIKWDRMDVIYAGCQKNLGPAGCSVVIVRRSLIGKADADVPCLCDWGKFEKSPDHQWNTPSTWSIYVMGMNVSFMN